MNSRALERENRSDRAAAHPVTSSSPLMQLGNTGLRLKSPTGPKMADFSQIHRYRPCARARDNGPSHAIFLHDRAQNRHFPQVRGPPSTRHCQPVALGVLPRRTLPIPRRGREGRKVPQMTLAQARAVVCRLVRPPAVAPIPSNAIGIHSAGSRAGESFCEGSTK